MIEAKTDKNGEELAKELHEKISEFESHMIKEKSWEPLVHSERAVIHTFLYWLFTGKV